MTEIPGYVPLASYDERGDDNAHSLNWKLLREAAMSGEVDGFQHGKSRRWLVHKVQADEFLAEKARRTVEVTVRRRGVDAVDVTTIGSDAGSVASMMGVEATMTLSRIETLLTQILMRLEGEIAVEAEGATA
jgi:hypothetical protein